jgi:hydrogenase expression/formation protein HypC
MFLIRHILYYYYSQLFRICYGGLIMCIAAPAQIVEIKREENIGFVDFGGVKQQVKLDLVDDIEEGKYVLVHAGYAIEVLDDKTAKESLEAWDELLEILDEEDKELQALADK